MKGQQHTPEPNNLEATVFVYRHKRTGKTQAHYIGIAQTLEDDPEWEHLGTVEPRMWIEHHYEAIEQRDELLAALDQFATWGRMQYKAQSKGCHATFDMMSLKDEIDLAESAIASVKGGE